MTQSFEAEFAGLVQDSKCPPAFSDWLAKQKLIDIESFGSAVASEILLKTDVTDVAKSDGVAFKNIGETSTVATLWRACRRALPEGAQAAAVPGDMPDPASGLSEGTEKGIKEKWSRRHAWILSDSLLLIRPLQAKLHKELISVPPNMGVYAMEQLRTMACLETKTATLLQIEPGEAVKGVEIAADSVAGHWQVYIRVRACSSLARMFALQTLACLTSRRQTQPRKKGLIFSLAHLLGTVPTRLLFRAGLDADLSPHLGGLTDPRQP